jgi:L-alanine-DL-glutamate epimerase-like enolase superfamily enzyme
MSRRSSVKITSVGVQLVEPGLTYTVAQRLTLKLANVVVRIQTDEGVEGVAGITTYSSSRAVAEAVAEIRGLLVGEDPLFRELIWQRLYDASTLIIPPQAIAALDCALWDLAGRAAGLPVFRLLGAYRDSVMACANARTYATLAIFQAELDKCLGMGFRAVKLHVWGELSRDIELCRAIRKQAGPSVALMVDASGSYDIHEALRLGRVLEQLGYEWLEMPIRDNDVEGYELLSAKLDIPVTSGEGLVHGFHDSTNYIRRRGWSILRIDAGISGGITAAKKTAALAEAHGMRCEIHSYGYVLHQVANLHVVGSIRNCRYFEVPMPIGGYNHCMIDTIDSNENGVVPLPTKPGLGLDIDWERMDAATVARF